MFLEQVNSKERIRNYQRVRHWLTLKDDHLTMIIIQWPSLKQPSEPRKIRTSSALVRSQVLYPLRYRSISKEFRVGCAPTTPCGNGFADRLINYSDTGTKKGVCTRIELVYPESRSGVIATIRTNPCSSLFNIPFDHLEHLVNTTK